MSFGPEGSLLLSAPPQGLGTTTSNSTTPAGYSDQTPSHPQLDKKYSHAPSLPQHGFTPQHPDAVPPHTDAVPQHSGDVPPSAMVSSEVKYHKPVEDFRPYNPAQKPEARTNRGPPKQHTPGESPDGKSASNGRKRARTKVVAWDPRDLEDIYVRKEVNREEWDSICRKLRDKKHREAMGVGLGTGKDSTYSNSPQPASNGIKWASVNGYQSSPADADSYHQRQSLDGEESSDDFELSSAPESDHDGRLSRQFELPARPAFDVFDAQSRGQPIAPRHLTPKHSSSATALSDHRSPLASDPRPNQRIKRGREVEAVELELQTTNNFNKRRKQPTETNNSPNTMTGMGEQSAMLFNPHQTMPIPQLQPRIFSDSELDDMCIRFRDTYRMMGHYYHEEHRINKELFDAAIDRANQRAATAFQKLDGANQHCAEEIKEARLSSQIEHENLKKKLASEISENRRLAEELASCRQRLVTANETSERESSTAMASNPPRSALETNAAPQPSLIDQLQQELRTVQEDAKRANAANNLLDDEVRKMRLSGRESHGMVQEIRKQHARVAAKIDHLVSQDLEDLTHKEVKKYILEVKAEDQGMSERVKQVEDFLSEAHHLTFGAIQQPPHPVANGSASGQPAAKIHHHVI
ncbi:MAG: hypothetical protein Q9169_002265 [Polycauliona sp. 2 TL-2023]